MSPHRLAVLKMFPNLVIALLALAMLWHGVIPQLDHYHEFADRSVWRGIPHAMDVLSNVGFAVVGAWGVYLVVARRRVLERSDWGYAIFILCLLLTAISSSYYHLAPDDHRLVWDRLPIALACAALLGAVRMGLGQSLRFELPVLLLAALATVIWWQQTGDLRPYLALQILTLLLIPLYQWIYRAALWDRYAFAAATVLYVVAKIAELQDASLLQHLKLLSGHSLKHLLAALAAACIVASLKKCWEGRKVAGL